MNTVINKYLILGFVKSLLNTILIFIALGIILNLFEEIEFFKNLNESLSLPLLLSLSFVPTLIIELLPFIIFISSMWYFSFLKSNTDLLSVKTFGYSNLRITVLLSFSAFIFGVIVLFAINPVTSIMVKFYEQTKAQYSRDVDHLISINKNGVWIKEKDVISSRIITAQSIEENFLQDVTIYVFNKNTMTQRIQADKVNIENSIWKIKEAIVYNFDNNIASESAQKIENFTFESNYTFNKINSLYRNLNTVSFVSLISEYRELNKKGYSIKILDERIHRFISLPVFLALMVFLASIFTIGSLKKNQNFYIILVSIMTCVVIYYFKDLSLALGQTDRINLTLSVWMPIIAVTLFCSIGVIQINEK